MHNEILRQSKGERFLFILSLSKPLIKVAKTGAWQRNNKKMNIRSGKRKVEKPVHGTVTAATVLAFFLSHLFRSSFLILTALQRISAPLHLLSLCFLTIERSTYHAKNKSSTGRTGDKFGKTHWSTKWLTMTIIHPGLSFKGELSARWHLQREADPSLRRRFEIN